MDDPDRTASLMTPAKLAQVSKPKAAATPAAWLDQMASDAAHQHVRRLSELGAELQAQAQLHDISPVAAELARLAEALPRLDFGLLQSRGWWARTTGKSRIAGAEFAVLFEQIEDVARGLPGRVQELRKTQQEQAGRADRSLLEVEVEFRAIDKIIDQGARWLQDMRNQLKTRTATANGEQAEQAIEDDAARCEILVDRLKILRAVSSAAQQAHEQAQAAAQRRSALSHLLQQALATDVKAWQARLSTLAAKAGDGKSPALALDEAMETHRELQLCVKQAIADCGQLDGQEKVLAHSLSALVKQLDAAS